MIRSNLLVAPDSRVVYPLLEGPLEMRKRLRAAPEPHLLAKVVPAFPAYATLPARDSDFQCYAVTNSESAHLRANGDHYP